MEFKKQTLILILIAFSVCHNAKAQDYSFHLDINKQYSDKYKVDTICKLHDSIYCMMPPPRFNSQMDYDYDFGVESRPTINVLNARFQEQGYDTTINWQWLVYNHTRNYFRIDGPDTLNDIKREIVYRDKSIIVDNQAYTPYLVRYSNYKTEEILMIIEVYPELNRGTYAIYYFINNEISKVRVLFDVSIYTPSYDDSLRYKSGLIQENDYKHEVVAYYKDSHLAKISINTKSASCWLSPYRKYYRAQTSIYKFNIATKTKWYWKKIELKKMKVVEPLKLIKKKIKATP